MRRLLAVLVLLLLWRFNEYIEVLPLLRHVELLRTEHQGWDRKLHPHIELQAWGDHGAFLWVSVRWPFYKWGYKTRGPLAVHVYNPQREALPND